MMHISEYDFFWTKVLELLWWDVFGQAYVDLDELME